MEYVTGRCMCHHQINHAFEPEDVSRMVYRVFAGHVQFHDGVDEVAPGITVHKIGGHTKGLQCVRVPTARGHVVLASDATHFYPAHRHTTRFPSALQPRRHGRGLQHARATRELQGARHPGARSARARALSGGIQVDCGMDSALGPGTAQELTQTARNALCFPIARRSSHTSQPLTVCAAHTQSARRVTSHAAKVFHKPLDFAGTRREQRVSRCTLDRAALSPKMLAVHRISRGQ